MSEASSDLRPPVPAGRDTYVLYCWRMFALAAFVCNRPQRIGAASPLITWTVAEVHGSWVWPCWSNGRQHPVESSPDTRNWYQLQVLQRKGACHALSAPSEPCPQVKGKPRARPKGAKEVETPEYS
jgi:hypothetical protein